MSVGLIQMAATSSGGVENSLASIDIPDDGRILEASIFASVDLDADLEFYTAECSFLATAQLGTNDARGVLVSMRVAAAVGAAGSLAPHAVNRLDYRPGLMVSAGERLFLHVAATAGVIGILQAHIIFDFVSQRTARMRRR